MTPKTPQTLKPFTAAKKLGVHLPATPESFQTTPLTRDEFAALSAEPPEWLAELRRTGPHPRPVVAQKLGVTISGLARAGVDDALTTDEIHALLEEMPAWLVTERANLAEVREEEQRVKDRDAGRALLRAERERAEAADQS
ncbi:DUF5997 family protein [Frigoribacterium faeni]|uniref:Uncharacterized protein n=1 Tax=Frigoribacterium faeni TaxID=145483 RepID=A0A7W3JJH3_9MICO|nr:DUF5997 family protein [Frigoribacterium faeni]MBA8813889.1 hypothetical protein [Frigoribacterium faeni]GEK82135.1 hypothetical protein FFA01_04440 [Frigoribacterium faeni]